MNVYLNKYKVIALLMMIDEAEGMITGSADGWYGLAKTNPELYEKIQEAVDELKTALEDKGHTFDREVRPIVGY